MSVCINVSTQPCGVLVTIHELVDARLVEAAADGVVAVARDRGGLVVDLPGTVPASPTELDLQAAAQPTSVVCDRLSGRRLLARRCRGTGSRVLDELPHHAGTSWTARSC